MQLVSKHRYSISKTHQLVWAFAPASDSNKTFLSLFPSWLRQFSRNKSQDYYQTLGVKRNAKRGEIKKAYFMLAKKYHPDVNSSAIAKEKFAKILAAYETLSDSKQRDLYNLENDYSAEGTWKGFKTEDHGEYSNAPNNRRRSKGKSNRQESQGFWDYQNEDSAEYKKEEDPFDEFFFTGGKQSATSRDHDLTRGKDLEGMIP